MRTKFNNICTFLFCFLLFLPVARAVEQESTRSIAPKEWQKLVADKAFDYKDKVQKIAPAKVNSSASGILQKLLLKLFNLVSSGFGKFVLWAIVLGLLIFIVRQVVAANRHFIFGKKSKQLPQNGVGEENEHLSDADWDAKLRTAIGQNDLPLAVRYSYMWLLQLLNDKKLIAYAADKTNHDYARELASTPYKQQFRQLSRQYEFTHYGNYPIAPAAYNEYIDLFNNVKSQLRK